MPKLSDEFKEAVSQLASTDKDKIIYKLARESEHVQRMLSYEFLGEVTREDLFNETKAKIDSIFENLNPGRNFQKQIAERIRRALKEIDEFKSITLHLVMYIDLHIYLLNLIFDRYHPYLGTSNRSFDTKLTATVKHTFELIQQLHEDYGLEYMDDLNRYFSKLHEKCSSIQAVSKLPRKLVAD